MQNYEFQKIRKDKTVLVGDYFDSPQTSLLLFHFEPNDFNSSFNRIKTCSINHASIENKDIYVFDGLFNEGEREELRDFFGKAVYNKTSYGNTESIEKGEKPAYSMDTKARWGLFSRPPQSIQELHKLLSFFANQLDAQITTQPWELSHQSEGVPKVIPSVIVNYHNEAISKANMDFGKHQDYKPEKGIFYGIPNLYHEGYHENQFVNGAPGKPWLVSLMLYSFSESFLPEYLMGTAFYKPDGEPVLQVNCEDARVVLFEGDIHHSPEESKIPEGIKLWRTSYVLKLIVNPTKENQCVKKTFKELLHKWQPHIGEITSRI